MTLTAAQVLQMQFDRLTQEFTNTLGNLGAQRLAWRPASRANDIGAMLWHSARTWDGYLVYIDGGADVFATQDWAKRFGIQTPVRGGWNDGYDKAQLECVRAQRKLFIEYIAAVRERTNNWLMTATPEQLDAPVKIPWWSDEKNKAYVLAHILRHSYQHLGEAQYVKGLMKQSAQKKTQRKAKNK